MKFNVYRIIFNKSKRTIIVIGFSLLIILALIDLVIDYRISFSIFYLLPVILVTWAVSIETGIIFSVLSACFWFIAAFLYHFPRYPLPVLIWDSIVRFGFFIIVTYIIHIFKGERRNARYDFLTMIPNRRYFNELFQAEVKRSNRYEHPLSIAYMDIDNFKTVNDMQGHYIGDNLLKVVSSEIKKHIRATDIVARLGGDEFAIILLETSEKPARELIQKVQKELLLAMERKGYPVTFSFGLVTFITFPNTPREMLKIADDCMYKAKRKGKNKIRRRVIAK
jgi:diguanylate cyclase (GGDEF)-like protein